MNRLHLATSPYLRQHADNPVHWETWNQDTLARARREGKPIIVSIGYATCHWCHVMAHESFEDKDVADLMNAHFVCIKVDREERPDVDQVYMEACQAIQGSGGWPLNAFLLPDARPFYAGTYYPPEPRYNRPSWAQVVLQLATQFRDNRAELEEQAERLTANIADGGRRMLRIEPVSEDHATWRATAMEKLRANYDRKHGGFGGAPKFPGTQALEALLANAFLHREFADLEMVEHAALALLDGGIYDQVGGGFSRYTVDAAWRVPHFEKMLYDNALILRLLAKLELAAPNPRWRAGITETLAWLEREMRLPGGGYRAALDADSEGVEGKYYLWDTSEIEALLPPDQARLFLRFYHCTPEGNWEEAGRNIPFRRASLAQVATELDTPVDVAEAQLAAARETLHRHRFTTRVHPGADDKILLQWNALLVSAFAWCYRATGDAATLARATDLYAFLASSLHHEGVFYRNLTGNQLGAEAFLDDYAALATAALDLHDATFDLRYVLGADAGAENMEEEQGVMPSVPFGARQIIHEATRRFHQPDSPLYALVPAGRHGLPTTPVDLFDNALPSGNGQLMHALLRLHRLTGEEDLRATGENMLAAMAGSLERYPSSFGTWLHGALLHAAPEREVVVTGRGARTAARAFGDRYRPGLLVVASAAEVPDIPLTRDRLVPGELTFYRCENQACQLPVRSAAEVLREL